MVLTETYTTGSLRLEDGYSDDLRNIGNRLDMQLEWIFIYDLLLGIFLEGRDLKPYQRNKMILKQILGLFNNVFQLNKLYRIE
jgi:hypothetical protein